MNAKFSHNYEDAYLLMNEIRNSRKMLNNKSQSFLTFYEEKILNDTLFTLNSVGLPLFQLLLVLSFTIRPRKHCIKDIEKTVQTILCSNPMC